MFKTRIADLQHQAEVPVFPHFLPSHSPPKFGGADRDRTGDPLLAKQVLSQLSYSPLKVVGLDRLELSTSPLSGVRSSHLSYRPSLRRRPNFNGPEIE